MGLADLQAAAARLSTDAAARRRLREDAAGFAREAHLEPEELASLLERAEELEAFARSLGHKRSQEAARALPLTRAALGSSLPRLFQAYAENHEAAGDPVLDALAFLGWLRGRPETSPPARDQARYERAALRFRRSGRRWQIGLYRFRAPAPGTFPRICLAVWWRPAPAAAAHSFHCPAFRKDAAL